jgi:hypothetical protein
MRLLLLFSFLSSLCHTQACLSAFARWEVRPFENGDNTLVADLHDNGNRVCWYFGQNDDNGHTGQYYFGL